jgi:hypothetical protein
VNLKYKNGEDALVHINEFQEFLNQLSLMNLELADEIQALIMLSSLPDNWETLVMSLSNSILNENITLKKMIKREVNAIEGEAKSIDDLQLH